MKKPSYRIPSMKEIEQIPFNGLTVVSTFSGAGGSCLGYRMAGYRVVYANEFIPAAQEAYKANHPHSYLDTRDIRQVKPEEILQITGLKKGELDLLDGSPPCVSFSSASGKREKSWGTIRPYSDTKQRVDDLFFEYIRILKGLQPKVFIAENVQGLIQGKAIGFFNQILNELKQCGYRVKAAVLDASRLGVPQKRMRLIFQGVRKDLKKEPVFPRPLPYQYTVKELFPYVKRLQAGGTKGKGFQWKDARRPAYTVTQSDGKRNSQNFITSSCYIEAIEHGERIQRKWNINELKKISSFPDDFILSGSFAQQWERIGRAVPPLLMRAIAETVAKEVFDIDLLHPSSALDSMDV